MFEVDKRPAPHSAAEAEAVRVAEKKLRAAAKKHGDATPSVPPGSEHPPTKEVVTVSVVRDPAVKAWVLVTAKGSCELCTKPAPFEMADGSPYLEVHHVRHLADGGADMVKNAVGVCPTCHRSLHFAVDRDERKALLLNQVARLVAE